MVSLYYQRIERGSHMKSADSRENLIEKIKSFLNNISPAKTKELETEIMHDAKIGMGDYLQLLSGRYPVEEMNDAQLFWVLSAISRISNRIGNVDDYFEPAEIGNYKFYDGSERKNKYNGTIIFENVQKLTENQYMFPLSVGDIKEMKEANRLQIVPELQRNYTKDKYGELKTKINKENAQEIANLIDNGEFFFNGIRFNLMDDGEADPPFFDEKNNTLTITSGTIIVPDGNHRSIACELATKHLDDKFGVFFTYLTATETRRVLNQEWTTVPIPKRHKEAMKLTIQNKIVDSIMRSHDADELYTKNIVKDSMELKRGNGFILYIEFADAISKYYDMGELKAKADQDELRDWLITFLNYLTKIMYNDFSNFKKIKKESWSVHYFSINYYIMLSSHLRGNLEWRDWLAKAIRDTDFVNPTILKYCKSGNKRGFLKFCREKEDEICTMLK